MRRFTLTVISLLIFVAGTFSQQSSAPEKLWVLSNHSSLSEFNTYLDRLVNELQNRPESTEAFVTLSGKAKVDRLNSLRNLLKAKPELKARINYSIPGAQYDKEWQETEFWIMPTRDNAPYEVVIYDRECASLAIIGPAAVAPRTRTINYTARVTGGAQQTLTFLWHVEGAVIISGQGTPSITVKRNPRANRITLDLTVGGVSDEYQSCNENVLHFTQVVAKVPPEL